MPVETAEVNANSSTEDIVKKAGEVNDAIDADSSTANEQGTEGQEDTTGKVEKTGQEVYDEDELDKGIKEGQAIPYDRFKKVNEERKALKSRIKEFEESQDGGINEETKAILNDPEVAALILKKQGFSDEAIAKKFQEAGIESKKEDGKEPNFDLSTVEGWNKKIEHTLNKILEKRLGPVEKTLTETQQKEGLRVFGERMSKEKSEAEKLAKEVYGIEYGTEEDAKDPTTATGKMWNYLQKHPEKVQTTAQGILSKSDLLRLAIAEEGVKLGENKGIKKEKDRVEKVKNAAMEGSETVVSDKVPTKDSSVEEILTYKDKHPDWKP